MRPDFDTMNETDVREIIVRPLLHRLGYQHGTEASIRTEVPLRYDQAYLGRKSPTRDPPLAGRADYMTLRMTPAMAAGVSDRLMSMEDVAALVDAANPVPAKRGPYKKKVAA